LQIFNFNHLNKPRKLAMKNPKVSVIIPTYNRESLIMRSIDSLLKQTNQDFEIIIADDASTDNTEQVIKDFNDPRVTYFKLEKNSGQCVSRNRAMKLAKGEYIGFLDSDDEWLPTKIEKQLGVFENSNDPKLAAVYCGFIEKDEVLGVTVTINRGNRRGNLYKSLLSGFCPSTPTMFLVKKDVLMQVNGFDENLPTFVDYDLWLRVAKLGYTFDFVDEPLIVKYEHAGEQIAKNLDKRMKGLEIFLNKWGSEIIKVAGIAQYKHLKKNKIETLVLSMVNNPGKEYKKEMKKSLKLLMGVSSVKIKLYLKALIILITGKKIRKPGFSSN
jgi:glycosyltransferase involved in cell wall biosynthesis